MSHLLMYWKQVGIAGWYLGSIAAYDEESKEHTIEWKDGRSGNWSVNLMGCRKIKEWRFVQLGEDVDDFLK